ncbi:MAG: cyanophycinase [Acidobacteria bacterium]|nr:cyanophycinase [Acidobacteriota bacterium]
MIGPGGGSPAGRLLLVGGAEDRRYQKVVLRRVVAEAGPGGILVVPAASSRPETTAREYEDAFGGLGAGAVGSFHVVCREDAESPAAADAVGAAGLVFFTGGDQVKLVGLLEGTRLMAEVRRRFGEGLAVAGTSAGAMACADPMLFDGDRDGLTKGVIGTAPGFGFVRGIAVDSHFLQRYRLLRLTQFLSAGHAARAIGLPEDGGVLLTPDGVLEALGEGPVTVLSRSPRFETDYAEREDRQPISATGLEIGFLSPGAKFDTVAWARKG